MLALVFDDRPWPGDERTRVVNRWCDDSGRPFAVGRAGARTRSIEWSGLGTFRFDDHSPDVRFHPVPGLNPAHASDVFARLVQPLILQAQGLPVLHASAVAGSDGAVIFCGVSGNGKSTLAYAIGTSPGFRQIADDAVVIRPGANDDFHVVPLPFRPRLRESAVAALGEPPATAATTPTPGNASSVPLHAVFALTQSAAGETPVVTRVPPAAAFRTLLTHAHCFDETDRDAMRHMVQTYLTMAEAVPVLHLTYRPDFRALAGLVGTVLRTVGTALPVTPR